MLDRANGGERFCDRFPIERRQTHRDRVRHPRRTCGTKCVGFGRSPLRNHGFTLRPRAQIHAPLTLVVRILTLRNANREAVGLMFEIVDDAAFVPKLVRDLERVFVFAYSCVSQSRLAFS
jgi:hypothetical protein